jgi:hypothetical protein
MSFLALASSAAIVIGLASAVPQLSTMLRARSAAGQSPLGWALGIVVNALMTYVNGFGYHALLLAAGNAASVAICVAATAIVLRFRRAADHEPAPASAAAPAPAPTVSDLATTEFWALREQLEREARRRRERQLVAA